MKKNKSKVKIIIALLVLALIGTLGFVFKDKIFTSKTKTDNKAQKTTTVKQSVYSTSIDVSGALEALDIQKVKIRATGTVTKVCVKEGDRVKKGDLLATIDDTDQMYDVANIRKQIESARISGTSSQKEIELLEMKLKSSEKKLDNTRAYANFDGVVVSVSIDEGDYFDAGEEVMTLIDDSKLVATVEIDEIDVQMLSEGDLVSITSDSSPGENITGYVSYIPMIGRYTTQGIGVMDVEITIDNPPKSLKPGFSFEGIIDIKTNASMLLVSQTAVKTKRGVSSVTKVNSDGSTQEVTIQVKYLGENLYQITGGDIKDGDKVLVNTTSQAGSTIGMPAMMPGGGPGPGPNGGRF